MTLNIKDVREAMPNYDFYKDWHRSGDILGIAIHHSATANRLTGAPVGDAATFFNYHVNTRGWAHGGYNYVITGAGEIEYALDDGISAYHAGFKDPDDSEGLEYGQFWDNHYLAICLAGWFSEDRTYRDESDQIRAIPNNYTHPSEVQLEALISLVQDLRQKLDHLVNVKRPALADRLHKAIQRGDLSENADYIAAKEEQGFLEGQIQQIEAMLRNVVIIEDNGPSDEVSIGSRVTVVEEGFEEEETFRIVGAAEANPGKGKVSNESPLGQALMGHRVGDVVTVEAPAGEIVFRIKAIE